MGTLRYHTGSRGVPGYEVSITQAGAVGSQTATSVLPGMVVTDSNGAELGTAANPLNVQTASGSTTNQQVVGNVASGTTDSGNPVKVGGKFNSTLPTFTNGQRGDFQITARGAQIVATIGVDNIATAQVSVATASTQIAAARAGRSSILITNVTGAQQVYIGVTGVTTTTGHLLPAAVGASISIPTTAAIFGISVTAAQTVSVLEVF